MGVSLRITAAVASILAAAAAAWGGIAVFASATGVPASSCTAVDHSAPITSGADPSVWHRGGQYYLVQSDGDRSISITAAPTLDGLTAAPRQIVWTSPLGTDHSAETWAPEIEYLDGRWMIYFAAATDRGGDPATNDTHRLFAITADSRDPLGSWSFGGRIADSTDQWAIDPAVFSYRGSRYLLWSGTPAGNGGSAPQQIYIARIRDALHLEPGARHRLSTPDRSWETSVQAIQEGPEPWVAPDGTLTIVYNADASWTKSYSLAALEYRGGDLTSASSYVKRGPVFTSAAGLFGPGGESRPVWADGQTWLVYHAKTKAAEGWDDRMIFAQPMRWTSAGRPDLGAPGAPPKRRPSSGPRCRASE